MSDGEVPSKGRSRPRWRRPETAVVVALIGLIGTLGAAVINGWLSSSGGSSSGPEKPSVSQTPPSGPSLSVEPDVVPVGSNYTVVGTGFSPYAEVALYYEYNPGSPRHQGSVRTRFGTYQADEHGNFRAISRSVAREDCDDLPILIYAIVGSSQSPSASVSVKVCPAS